MAIQKKTQTPIASYRSSKQDLSAPHITTTDFMKLNVAKAMELVPGQRVNIEHSCFARFDPLEVPTMGFANIVTRGYFVPFRTIFPAWDDFNNDTPHVYSTGEVALVNNVPLISENVLSTAFLQSEFVTRVDDAAAAYDFEYIQYTGANTANDITERRKYNFNPQGRMAYNLLRQLGYTITFTNAASGTYSLLPLFALCRVYVDNFYTSQYANDADSAWLLSLLNNNNYIIDNIDMLSVQDVIRLFRIVSKVSYTDDYFVNAWDKPNMPNDNLYTPVKILDITDAEGTRQQVQTNSTGDESNAPQLNADGQPLYNISQFALNALRKLTDYMKRNQIAGSRALDRYLARFGVKLQAEKLNRSVYLGYSTQRVQFGDVTSMSDTEGASLGSYAGKGLSYGEGNFSYETDEYGMLILVNTIVPEIGYYEGINRHCKHLTKFDFWTPEFDSLGVQALSKAEVYSPVNGIELQNVADYHDQVFGFVPRYSEYKVPYAQITGDFIMGSRNVGKDSWTLLRSVKPFVESVGSLNDFEHDYNFVTSGDSNQYNRIFQITDNTHDHINVMHFFKIDSYFPGKSLYDNYDFENEGESRNVSLDVNGETHN